MYILAQLCIQCVFVFQKCTLVENFWKFHIFESSFKKKKKKVAFSFTYERILVLDRIF